MTFTGTASLNNREVGYEIIQSINGYATAKIFVNDKSFSNIATLKANLLKSIIQTEDIYSNVVFRGELRNMTATIERVSYNAFDKARKVLNQRANYNPIVESGYFRGIGYNAGTYYLEDPDKNFGSLSELVGHLVHFVKSGKQTLRISPNDFSSATATVFNYAGGGTDTTKQEATATGTYTETGDIRNIYLKAPIEDPDINNYIRHRIYTDSANFQDLMFQADCYFSLRSSISVSQIKQIYAEMTTRPLAKFGVSDNITDPCIGILEVSTSTKYDVSYITGSDVGGRYAGNSLTGSGGDFQDSSSSLDSTPFFIKRVSDDNIADLSANPSKYISSAIATDGDTSLYRIRLGFFGGQDGANRKLIKLREVYIDLELDAEQYPEIGAEVIASHTSTKITFGDNGADGKPPLLDGVGRDDVYIITDTLDDQINTLATQWSITINDNITNSSKLALTGDYTNSSRYQVLQDICDISNSVWWYDASGDSYEIVSADNLTSTSITITKNDIMNYLVPNAWSYTIDADNIRDNIYVKGDSNVGVVSVATTPEFTHALGDEDIIIKRPGVHSQYHVKKLLANETPKYENARRTMVFTLDLDKPNQSYATLALGKTIAVQLPTSSDTSLCNHTTAGDGELLITQLQWSKKDANGQRNRVTVTAEARYT